MDEENVRMRVCVDVHAACGVAASAITCACAAGCAWANAQCTSVCSNQKCVISGGQACGSERGWGAPELCAGVFAWGTMC